MPEVNIDGRIRFVTQGMYPSNIALVFYDYFLTLDLEVQNIWRKQFRLPTLIFLLNRYLGIAFSIALMYPAATQEIVFGTLLSLTEAVFFALRAYALWGCKRVIFIAVILAYIPGFSANLCTMLLRDAPATLALNTLIPVFFILFDTLVLSLSLAALWRSHGSSLSKLGGLPALFFQHGIIYFV
ncbi:hypothetical protein BDY19DRAFT_972629 [Irpex rosettiformis]|uniref:Uncharacterized protein n=1 Tax=Irpex rosettiformis TaxID=378272 RepID=A0ACB8TQP7_9APHY|nr:hypothetical protein BDY19DRAFT_972629 [Irpex rosettiformis]